MKTDFYTFPHKIQRQHLFALSNLLGEANFNECNIFTSIENDLFAVIHEIKSHAFHEETFVHPLLIRKLPRLARSLHHDHTELDQWFIDLEVQFAHLKSLGEHYPKCQEQGQAFYRLFNGFIANYLLHMNEEEQTMHSLWELAAPPELVGMMMAFLTYAHKEEANDALQNSLKQFNATEKALLFNTVKLMAPADIYIAMQDAMMEEIVK